MQPQVKNLRTIAEVVNEMMQDSGRIFNPQVDVPQIHAFNLYNAYKHKLTKEAQQAIEGVKVHQLIHERNEDVSGIYEFLKLLNKTGNQGADARMLSMYNGTYRRVIDKVVFIGRLATIDKLETAVDKVCRGLNRLAKRGYITGALEPLIGIRLQRTSKRQKPKVIVVSYVAVTAIGEKYLNEKMKKVEFLIKFKESRCYTRRAKPKTS